VALLVRITVLAPVQFNRQFSFLAEKIEIVFAYRMLASEFITAEAAVTQPAPH
jgi:hypothetical protein